MRDHLTQAPSGSSRKAGPGKRPILPFVVVGSVILGGLLLWMWRGRGRAFVAGRIKERRHEAKRSIRPVIDGSIKVIPQGLVTGTVSNVEGASIPGAQVCTRPLSSELAGGKALLPICQRTDEQGGYTLTVPGGARYPVTASAPGYIPGSHVGPENLGFVYVERGQRVENVDIVLVSGGVKVHGTVKDIGGGVVAGAQVRLKPVGRTGANAFAWTDDKGIFEAWVALGVVDVAARADGYAPASIHAVAPGQHMELWLTPESALSGKVVDAITLEPVKGARVEAQRLSSEGGGAGGESATSDEQGLFRIGGLLPGLYKPTAESADRYGRTETSVLLGLAQTADNVIIRVFPAFEVRARIVMERTGAPCGMGSVSLRSESTGEQRRADTDNNGRVRIKGVSAGTHSVWVHCKDRLPADSYPDIEVPGDKKAEHRFEVKEGSVIEGVVVDSAGEPVHSVGLVSRQTGGTSSRGKQTFGSGSTDVKGRFRMGGLAAGRYLVEATCPADLYLEEPVKVRLEPSEKKEIRVVLSRGGGILGEVVDEAGGPVKGADVTARSKKLWTYSRKLTTVSRDDGTFELKGIPPGPYRVQASTDRTNVLRSSEALEEEMQGQAVRVEGGHMSRVRMVVETQDLKILGSVVDGKGNPLADVYVDAKREDETPGRRSAWTRVQMRWDRAARPVITEMDGSFEIPRLVRGRYTVRAYRKGGGESVVEHVEAGSKITLEIKATSSISGTVEVPDGPPPRSFNLSVQEHGSGYRRYERFFMTEGRWDVQDLPEGEFVLTVDTPEGTANETVKLSEGENRKDLRLVLDPRITVIGRVVAMDTHDPLPGFMVYMRQVKGDASSGFWDKSRRFITNDSGRFEIENAPQGRLFIFTFPSTTWETSEYGWTRILIDARGERVHDAGRIEVPRRRTKGKERAGDLGYRIQQQQPGSDPKDQRFMVSYIRPDGPADYTGLEVGHEIVSVDGQDVTRPGSSLYYFLTMVRANTTIRLGLKTGQTIFITAREPL